MVDKFGVGELAPRFAADSSTSSSSSSSRKRHQHTPPAMSKSKMDYLSRYMSSADAEQQLGKKKRRKKKVAPTQVVHDDDVVAARSEYLEPEDRPVVVDTGFGTGGAGGGGAGARRRARSASAGSMNDASPPRRARYDTDSGSDSGSGSDAPRQRRRHDSDCSGSDRGGCGSDASPPRRGGRGGGSSGSDASPPRRRGGASDSDSDASPPRRGAAGDSDSDGDGKSKMESGQSTGLQKGKDIQAEIQRLRAKENDNFNNASAADTGRGAETVYRDKSGRKVAGKGDDSDGETEQDAKVAEWGKGLVQKRGHEKLAGRLAKEKGAPFARTADDEAMNDEMKEVVRWGDPMAHLVSNNPSKKKKPAAGQRPRYSGPRPPPNRHAIAPGYRWDGVDRGNGFEARFLAKANARKVGKTAKHAWSTADM